MHRLGRRSQIAIGILGIAAAFALVQSTSELARPAAAAREPIFSVEPVAVDRQMSLMAATHAAMADDVMADVKLQNMLAEIAASRLTAVPNGGRTSGKAGGKRKPGAIDISRVPSGLDDSGAITPARGGRSEQRRKSAQKLAEDLFVWSRDDTVVSMPAQGKSSKHEMTERKSADPNPATADLLVRSLATSIGE